MDAFVIRSRVVLTPSRQPTRDDISDLIEVLSDRLDERGHEPDISTHLVDGRVEMILLQHVTARSAMSAQRQAIEALEQGFEVLQVAPQFFFDDADSVESSASRELAPA